MLTIIDESISDKQLPIGHCCQFFIMSNNNEGLIQLFPQFKEKLMQFERTAGVKISGWFISHYNSGFVDQRSGNSYSLLLTT